MLFLGSFERMKWTLFWVAFCVVELSGKAAGTPTTSTVLAATDAATKGTSSMAATGEPAAPSSSQPTPQTSMHFFKTEAVTTSQAASPTLPGLSTESVSSQPSQAPTLRLGTPSEPNTMTQGVSTSGSPATQPNVTAQAPRSTPALTSSPATSGHHPTSVATTQLDKSRDNLKSITCHNIKEVNDTGAICLQLNESNSCKQFLERKGSDLWSAICEESAHHIPSPCKIQLAKSEVDRDCMLLILVGEKDPATNVLQESHWEKFGIKSLKPGRVRSHQDFSQKTLIALVTSGLVLAFLGLAGYFLMKRRSWSPAGERLAEDPYYVDNGSQGNTMLMMPHQEQAELQEKPNLNGGTQENGTGQASSQNGHSARQHSPADTEM